MASFSQGFAILGQVVGSYFGPVGAAIGGAIGASLGGMLDPDQVFEGPRLSDLKVQNSGHGGAVPIVFGAARIAGNVIYASDIRETRIEHEQSGKGGPSVVQTEYLYEVDCAIAIAEGELTGVERIYANGVLIYDARSGASPQNIFASGQWVNSITFYPGNETQQPDPMIEAAHGVGNVSAYRGTAYIALRGVQLNTLKTAQLPNFEFVVARDATIAAPMVRIFKVAASQTFRCAAAPTAAYPHVQPIGLTTRVNRENGPALSDIVDLDGNLVAVKEQNPDIFPVWSFPGGGTGCSMRLYDGRELRTRPQFFVTGGRVFVTESDSEIFDVGALIPLGASEFLIWLFPCVADGKTFIFITQDSGANQRWYKFEWNGTSAVQLDEGPASGWSPSNTVGGESQIAYYTQTATCLESDHRNMWWVHVPAYLFGTNRSAIAHGAISEAGLLTQPSIIYDDYPSSATGIDVEGSYPSIYADKSLAIVASGASVYGFKRSSTLTPDGIPLEDVIAELCDRAGLEAADVDVTAISDTVDGFVIGQTMTARAALEALRGAYHFDCVDGEKVKFVPRGSAAVGTFEYLDLGAGADDPAVALVESRRRQETELPARVNVRYLSSAADYLPSAQSARRETTSSREVADVSLAIVMSDTKAAQVADVLLRAAWASATTRRWSSTLAYAAYEPTDVVEVDDGVTVRTARITRRVDKGGFIEWEGEDEDIASYDSNAIGVPVIVPTQVLGAQGATLLEVLDLPPLTELEDGNESALYIAARGYLASWSAAAVQVSRNVGATYETAAYISTVSVMGSCTTELPDFFGGNVFDEASVLRVNVGASGTLSSATTADVLNGANGAAVGDEVIQFRTATPVSTGVYDLTGLLRGRKGTEWATADHAVGERFVLLTTNLRNLPINLSDRAGATLYVRAVTAGTLASDADVDAIAPQIARLMPYSPVHLRASKDAAGDWLLRWSRRDRYANDWNDGTDVPMSEASEVYDIDVMLAGVVVASYVDVVGTGAGGTQAVLSTVLGSGAASITFRVYQKSSVVGRGFVAEATVAA